MVVGHRRVSQKKTGLFVFVFLLSPLAFSQQKSSFDIKKYILKKVKTKSGLTQTHYDLNQDKKVDLVDVYMNKTHLQRKEDLNFDGRFDKTTTFYSRRQDGVVKKIQWDKNFDGKIDRRETFKENLKFNKMIIKTEIDKGFSGKLNYSFNQYVDLKQENSCSMGNFSHLRDVNGQLLNKGFHPKTKEGLNIHNGCFSKFNQSREETVADLSRSIRKGSKCFLDLSKKVDKEKQIVLKRNSIKVAEILKEGRLKILCDDSNVDDESNAYASNPGQVLENYNSEGVDVRHPFISLSKKSCARDQESLANTVFHEIFHIIGYHHGQGVEYAYACAEYCFTQKRVSRKIKQLSADICTLDENNYDDKKYVEDLIEFTHGTGRTSRPARLRVLNYIRENPEKKNWGLIQWANAVSKDNAALAAKFLKKIKKTSLTSSERNLLNQVERKSKKNRGGSRATALVADAMYSFYDQEKTKETLDLIESKISAVKGSLDKHERKILQDILFEINTESYGVEPRWADKSADLYDELKPPKKTT